MDYFHSAMSSLRDTYNNINPATLSGAIDVVAVEGRDGRLSATPFHVRFGKYGVFSAQDKLVDIIVNEVEIKHLKMKLDGNGIAYFVVEEEITDDNKNDYQLASPMPAVTPTAKTDEILAESARRLDESKEANVPSTSAAAIERKISALVGPFEAESDQVRRKKTLPYMTSLFSSRQYRSLPDLSEMGGSALPDTPAPCTSVLPLPEPAAGPETSARTPDQKSEKRRTKVLRGSRSMALTPPNNRRRAGSARGQQRNTAIMAMTPPVSAQSSSEDVADLSAATNGKPTFRASSAASATAPINIASRKSRPIDDSDSDDEVRTGYSSVSSTPSVGSPDVSPTHLDNVSEKALSPEEQRAREYAAEAALSDSELETRHRGNPERDNQMTDWKWGELPRSQNDATETKNENGEIGKGAAGTEKATTKRSGGGSWFWWRKTAVAEADASSTGPAAPSSSVTSTDTTVAPSKDAEEGIYLDELVSRSVSDPVAVERYLGKKTSSSSSANSHLQQASPPPNGTAIAPEKTEEWTRNRSAAIQHRGRSPAARSDTSDVFSMSGASDDESDHTKEDEPAGKGGDVPPKRLIRSVRLGHEQLATLGLRKGANDVRFSITTRYQGTAMCLCKVFLYSWDDQLVISDIDGTITKSDVLGHVIPAIGGQWAHAGVAELFTQIARNGYRFIYLSSRAIGQSHYTRQYLRSVQQESRALPEGPVILSPTSVLVAFRREVIERRPEEFKIAALTDIRQLFQDRQPFFAGFGNRNTDVVSYLAVDIPAARILLIDPTGSVRRPDGFNGFSSSYQAIAHEAVDYFFPPLATPRSRHVSVAAEDPTSPMKNVTDFYRPLSYSTVTFWSESPKEVEEDELAAYAMRNQKIRDDKNQKKRRNWRSYIW